VLEFLKKKQEFVERRKHPRPVVDAALTDSLSHEQTQITHAREQFKRARDEFTAMLDEITRDNKRLHK
jgi:hypothetical protein